MEQPSEVGKNIDELKASNGRWCYTRSQTQTNKERNDRMHPPSYPRVSWTRTLLHERFLLSTIIIKAFLWCLFFTRRPKCSRFPGKEENYWRQDWISSASIRKNCRFSLVRCPDQHISAICSVPLPFCLPTNECKDMWTKDVCYRSTNAMPWPWSALNLVVTLDTFPKNPSFFYPCVAICSMVISSPYTTTSPQACLREWRRLIPLTPALESVAQVLVVLSFIFSVVAPVLAFGPHSHASRQKTWSLSLSFFA